MSLIKCNECGKEYSDKAEICPNCGCPNKKRKVNYYLKQIGMVGLEKDN